MYTILRRLHLFSAFLLGGFILMYFFTGFVMIFESTFTRKNVEELRIERIISHLPFKDPEKLAETIQRQFDIRGQYSVRLDSNQAIINFSHPGVTTNVRIPYSTDSVFITTKRGNLNTVLHQFHRIHGYRGGWNYYAWALAYDLSAMSLIAFALTGMYLWIKFDTKPRAGWMIFAVSTAITGITIIYLMYFS